MRPTPDSRPKALSVDANLIFDIGAHLGLDTAYYLSQGYRVVAVEPLPEFHTRLQRLYASENCFVFPFAITADGKPTPLYLSAHRLGETHSLHPGRVRGCTYDTVIVPGITLPELIESTAVPHYIKIDIEGADILPLRQLAPTPYRPSFISLELDHRAEEDALEAMCLLWGMGYREAQLVNQTRVRDGGYGEHFMGGGYSGPFGGLLPSEAWMGLAAVMTEWLTKHDTAKDECWYDLHVRHSAYGP